MGKPIRRDNFALAMFLGELDLQCSLAEFAFQQLKQGTVDWQKGGRPESPAAPIDLLSRATAFLSAAAMIAKLLFLGARRASTSPKAARRTTVLQALLDVDSLPALTRLETRNSLEHFDERLDEHFSVFTSGTVQPISMIEEPPKPGTLVLKRIDPRALTIQVAGETIALEPCMQDIAAVRERIAVAMAKLAEAHVPLWLPDPPGISDP